ncbi:MAG TPA: isoprenyl transferase [Beijerinckiaceae bacterium]|nr:isoprenyl transferase [Beijerinckiaceae bacterium]
MENAARAQFDPVPAKGGGAAPFGLKHVGIIMDGNGRWAKQRGLPRAFGHRAGVETLRGVVRTFSDLNIPYLTVYSFSSENWARPASEVAELMSLLRLFIRSDLADLNARNVRIKVIGERAGLQPDIVALLNEAEDKTRTNTGLTFAVAFNYGARHELVMAARRLAELARTGRLEPCDISEARISAELTTAGMPDPDLIIRTSGEQRLSNFLMWQAAYAEFVFTPVLWPDFDRAALETCLTEFGARTRRFGGL